MPSSSQRSTQVERDIFATYTAVFARLQAAKRHILLRDTSALFGELLDITPDHLRGCVLCWDNKDALAAENKESWDLSVADRVWTAGSLINNVAWMLVKRYGRDAAAADCFGVAARLKREAEMIQEEHDRREEEAQRRRDRMEQLAQMRGERSEEARKMWKQSQFMGSM